MRYGLIGKIGTQPGRRDEVVEILLRDVGQLAAAGCQLYVVQVAPGEPNALWVTEVWESAEAHRASLTLPSVQQAISEARPMLSGEFDRTELKVAGGLGLPAAD